VTVFSLQHRRLWLTATSAALAIGVLYALSPLAVWFGLAAWAIVRWAGRGLPEDERRVIQSLLVIGIALRVAAVIGLFAITDHAKVPFATFFGDEAFFIRRSIWLRNIALGLPVHSADLIYTFDQVGQTSYLYVLALTQILVGPSPYGVHLLGIAFYLAATVLLYRFIRPTLGRMPALIGFVVLLFLPSLFAWSVSALKEPADMLLTASSLVAAVTMVRSPRWRSRVIAALVVVAVVFAADSFRRLGGLLTAASVVVGLVVAAVMMRPRLLLAAIVVVPIAIGLAGSRPAMQVRALDVIQQGAWQQQGHINTPWVVYKTLDDRFYFNTRDIGDMGFAEAGRFVGRAIWAYLTVPLPWDVQSRSTLAYMPEQIAWYVLAALVPAGLLLSLRRDVLVTALLISYAAVWSFVIAITSGNVGTLIRHRSMAIPYLVWLSAVAGCELLCRFAAARRATIEWPGGRPAQTRTEGIWL
jgi:hypothetical protein